MRTLPFIDICGDDQIQTILDDPANFNLQVFRAETLSDWIPDLGTYLAPCRCRSQNGVFRTPGLAASGLPAEMRHRFWRPADAARVVGPKYIGLLLYDSVNDDYTFELSAGSEPVGALRPWRHDNRRHLLVTPEPTLIRGGHIPFVVRALGQGPCYLESVVFMPRRPEATSFRPTIQRLSTRVADRRADRVTAEVHFVTDEAATARVVAVASADAPSASAASETVERLHVLTLPDLLPDRRYRLTVTATERGGATAEATVELDTAALAEPASRPIHIPLEIVPTAGQVAADLPLTFGVPVARGRLVAPPRAVLRTAGQTLPAQTRVHARWPDGSARWVLVDVPAPAPPAGSTSTSAELVLGGAALPSTGLTWETDTKRVTVRGERIRLTVDRAGPTLHLEHRTATGEWQTATAGGDLRLTGALADGTTVAGGPLADLDLEEAGPERAVIRFELPLQDDHGVEHFRTTLRLHVYARQPFVRLVQRTVVTSPVLGAALGVNDLSHLTPELERLRSVVDSAQGEGVSLLLVRKLELRLPWGRAAAGEHWRVLHEHDREYRLDRAAGADVVAGRWPGVATWDGAGGRLAVGVKHFWQTYPKALRRDEHGITLEILPPLAGRPFPEYDHLWHKLYFWVQPEQQAYRLKVGMALTTEMVIGFPHSDAEPQTWQDWLETPPAVRPDLAYFNAADALLPIAPKADSPAPQYEALMDGHASVWAGFVDARHEYGFLSFGDTYSDFEGFWSNNEYDATLCHYLEFLRGGDPLWYLLGARSARHVADVDTCNYSRHAAQVGAQYMHMPGHAGGFLPPYFRSKMAGSSSKPSHSWIEGVALHYALTGDETLRAAFRETWLRFTRGLRFYDFTNARECGWHLTHLTGIARLEDDPRPLNAAAIIVETVLSQQSPGGGWDHPLSEAHCHCPPPHCHGEAGFMVGVLLSGLRRYHALTGDPRVAEAIVGGARWLAYRTFLPDLELFRYTSCPTCREPGFPAEQLVEGLAMAQRLAPEPRVGHALRVGLGHLDRVTSFHTAGEPRYGRELSPEARYVPLMLTLLPPNVSARLGSSATGPGNQIVDAAQPRIAPRG